MTEELPSREDVAAVLGGEQTRTVAAERDLSRVHHWLDTAVKHAVNEAAQALNSIRYWCDQAASVYDPILRENPKDYIALSYMAAVTEVRNLLPELPPVGADSTGGGGSDERHESDPAGRRPGHVTPDP